MINRRFRNRSFGRSSEAYITNTKNEPYAISYLLSVLFENKPNSAVMTEYDEGINAFLECVEKLNKRERLEKILEAEVKNLEKQKILKPLECEQNEVMAYDDSDIPYIYEQDKRIDRAMRHYDNIDETLINLHRVIFCSSKPIFSEMIKATIFGEEDKIFDANDHIIKELTLQEIADKFGVKPENLRIKK